MIILAAAMGLNNELGKDDGVPLWNLPDEYNHFRQTIKNHPIIFGRKSFDVVHSPIPESLNIVITRNPNYDGHGAKVVHSIKEAVEVAGNNEKVYIVGGGGIFKEAVKIADRMEISRINATFPAAQAFFPEFSKDDWQLIDSKPHPKDERHAFSFEFQTWERIKL